MDAATKRFENELTGLIERHGATLTDNQVITVLERALDEALAIAGDPERTKIIRAQREFITKIGAMADAGTATGETVETLNDIKWAIRDSGLAE